MVSWLIFSCLFYPPSSVPEFVLQLFLLLDVTLGAEGLHKSLLPRVKEKRAAEREKGKQKGEGKIQGERSQRRRGAGEETCKDGRE